MLRLIPFARLIGFQHVNVSKLVKEKDLHGGKHEDEELDTFVLDEDKICDDLEDQMSAGGNVVDFHTVSAGEMPHACKKKLNRHPYC
jgi:broad-specificity NMP kinase